MSEEVGKGFARRVTGSNLMRFAPLLRDLTKKSDPPASDENPQSEPRPGTRSDELADAESLFQGLKVRVALRFTFPPVPSGTGTPGGTSSGGNGSAEEEDGDVPSVNYPVLVAEIPGAGRWTQASFSQDVFSNFFGAGVIGLTYMNAQGQAIHETRNPVTKGSSNYCYELAAARGLNYPDKNVGRPIGVFLRFESGQFQYVIVMPRDPGYAMLATFLTSRLGEPGRLMRRETTDLESLLGAWPSAPLPLPLVIPNVADS